MRAMLWVLILAASASAQAEFMRGDSDADGNRNIGDAIALLNYLFADAAAPACTDAADANDDGRLNIADAVTVLYYLFADTALPEPVDACGADPTADDLPCEVFDPCPQCPEECWTPEALDGEALETLMEGACVPSPWAEFEAPLLGKIVVCPDGSVCTDGSPGCQVQFTEVAFDLDADKGEATLHAVGHIEDLPIDVGPTGSTHCKADVDFVIDGIGTFEAEDVGCGYMQVMDITGFEIALTSIDINASGGLVCSLLGALGGLFRTAFEEQVAQMGQQFLEQYEQELVGMVICPAE